jgi:uncharacterized protein with HEPN domain
LIGRLCAISCITSISSSSLRPVKISRPSNTDTLRIYAVIRCLEVISEASRRLPDDLKARHPAIAWKEMAGAGNVYRHDYQDVASRRVWDTVRLALPPLRTVIVAELSRSNSNEP